jgi:hypothetical protein
MFALRFSLNEGSTICGSRTAFGLLNVFMRPVIQHRHNKLNCMEKYKYYINFELNKCSFVTLIIIIIIIGSTALRVPWPSSEACAS